MPLRPSLFIGQYQPRSCMPAMKHDWYLRPTTQAHLIAFVFIQNGTFMRGHKVANFLYKAESVWVGAGGVWRPGVAWGSPETSPWVWPMHPNRDSVQLPCELLCSCGQIPLPPPRNGKEEEVMSMRKRRQIKANCPRQIWVMPLLTS